MLPKLHVEFYGRIIFPFRLSVKGYFAVLEKKTVA